MGRFLYFHEISDRFANAYCLIVFENAVYYRRKKFNGIKEAQQFIANMHKRQTKTKKEE